MKLLSIEFTLMFISSLSFANINPKRKSASSTSCERYGILLERIKLDVKDFSDLNKQEPETVNTEVIKI